MGDTLVTSYYLPGHERGGQQALQVVTGALAVYSERFGRYPYTEMDVAETAFTVMGSPGGMEFPGLIFISSEFYGMDSFYAFPGEEKRILLEILHSGPQRNKNC